MQVLRKSKRIPACVAFEKNWLPLDAFQIPTMPLCMSIKVLQQSGKLLRVKNKDAGNNNNNNNNNT